jgi:phosphoserine phosphatase RsbU/P
VAAQSRLRAHTLAYAVLAALFLLSVSHFSRDAIDRIDAVRHAGERVREPFYLGDANWGAIGLQPEAEAAGLKYGNAVLAVNGRPVDGFFVYYGALRQARVGDRLRVQVRTRPDANPVVKDLSIELRPYGSNAGAAGLSGYVAAALSSVALPAVCVALGFWVTAVRIRDPSAWLLLAVLLSLAAFIGGGSGPQGAFGRENLLQPLFIGFHAFLSLIATPALMLFGISFPERLAIDRRVPWLKWIIVGHLTLVSVLEGVNVGLWVHHLPLSEGFQHVVEFLTGASGDFGAGVGFVALAVGVGSLAYKTVTEPSRDARRRLLLLDIGAAASISALVAVMVLGRLEIRLSDWPLFPLITMWLAFPLTMAYVIVVHRAMDVRVVIRQGVQYVLARGGIRVIQLALTVAVTIAATSLLSGGAGPVRVAMVVAGIAVIVAIGGRFADRLRTWVDRRFFREAYEADAILTDLAMKVRTMVEIGPLLETVGRRIAESLHVPQIAILIKEHGAFRPAYALGYGSAVRAAIPEESVTVKRLRQQQHALVVFDDPDSWVQVTDGEERASLEELRPELLLPVSVNENVLGIMSLGPKQSEEPFSKTDIRLLDSVAAQTGLALENARLTEAIKAETAAREKHRRELEIAHDVQQRLFPQELPPMPGLDYAGACRPALGVGGDYYDFIALSNTMIGIAIGDVSGKGIPAALLMATLRAYLRGQITQRQADLTVVMANLNKLVFESSAANRYATFFYAELDASSRTLRYVNAGHNPPMLFRQSSGGREILRLDTGGPVIGLMEECVYREGQIPLEAGDVLVAYTDGVSEAMNGSDVEWGEERLMNAVWPNRTAPSAGLIDRIMAAADAFVADAPQYDDMTLVVVRVTDANKYEARSCP